MAEGLQIRAKSYQSFTRWKENCFEFLIACALKDFNVNLRACHLKKFEKKQLIGKMKNITRRLE